MFQNPNYQSNAPLSSVVAGKKATKSGFRVKHAKRVYDLLKKNNGSTAIELMAAQPPSGALGEYPIRRRLTDLSQAGCIREGTIRKCKVKGSLMTAWYINGPFVAPKHRATKVSTKKLLAEVLECVKVVRKKLKKGGRCRKALWSIETAAHKGILPPLEDIKKKLKK